jgi:hypothetical protein
MSILLFSSSGFRFPLTTLPTPAPLEPGRPILEIGGLAFFNSRVTVAPTVVRFEWVLEVVLGATFSLALLLGSSPLTGRG